MRVEAAVTVPVGDAVTLRVWCLLRVGVCVEVGVAGPVLVAWTVPLIVTVRVHVHVRPGVLVAVWDDVCGAVKDGDREADGLAVHVSDAVQVEPTVSLIVIVPVAAAVKVHAEVCVAVQL